MKLRIPSVSIVVVLLAGVSAACQLPRASSSADIVAWQVDPTSRCRYVDIGETDYQPAVKQMNRRLKELAALEDVAGCARLETRKDYLSALDSRQDQRSVVRKRIERREWERAEAERYGKADVAAELAEEIARERTKLDELRRVRLAELASSIREGYGVFLLDLGVLQEHELETLTVRLDERADAYRTRASLDRARISGDGPYEGRSDKKVQGKLGLLQADERFADRMAADVAEISRLIRAGELDAAQALADQRWSEAIGA